MESNMEAKPEVKTTMFQRAQQKCMGCDKTVYLVDKVSTDSNRHYHKTCFKCNHCKSTLKLSNYNSFEGVLYCKPHYDQLFKRVARPNSGIQSFEGMPKIAMPETERPIENEIRQNALKALNSFRGTKEKCLCCNKTAYPTERVTVNGTAYHKSCFKCTHGGCTISPSNYIAFEGKLYCKHHHSQLFKAKGNYSQLENDREKQQNTMNFEVSSSSMEISAES